MAYEVDTISMIIGWVVGSLGVIAGLVLYEVFGKNLKGRKK